MNFLKKGPELKLSQIKVPAFVQDVYYDLKDRHLLPVAAILVAAMIAVPIAINSSGTEEETPGGGGGPGATISSGASRSDTLVAKSAPGLRKYEKRLDYRQATNPFTEKFKGSQESDAGQTEAPTDTGATQAEEPTFSTVPSEPSGEETTGGGSHEELTYYSYAIDVRISGGSDGNKSTVRRNLPELTMLPSRETPAIVYMGSTVDGKKAVMTVSSDVQAIFGDAKCVLGSETCQLLAMEVGLPETFVYGGAGKTYTIELLKVELVESDKLNKAPLGESGEKKKKGKTRNESLAAAGRSR